MSQKLNIITKENQLINSQIENKYKNLEIQNIQLHTIKEEMITTISNKEIVILEQNYRIKELTNKLDNNSNKKDIKYVEIVKFD